MLIRPDCSYTCRLMVSIQRAVPSWPISLNIYWVENWEKQQQHQVCEKEGFVSSQKFLLSLSQQYKDFPLFCWQMQWKNPRGQQFGSRIPATNLVLPKAAVTTAVSNTPTTTGSNTPTTSVNTDSTTKTTSTKLGLKQERKSLEKASSAHPHAPSHRTDTPCKKSTWKKRPMSNGAAGKVSFHSLGTAPRYCKSEHMDWLQVSLYFFAVTASVIRCFLLNI